MLLAPKRPADAQRSEAEFVAGGVDGFDAGEAKVPKKVGLGEGRKESAAGSVDVDGDVEAGVGLQLVESDADGVDRLELEGEGDAESDDDADGVFIATLEDLFWREQEAITFHGDFADFDVEITAELVPANLNRAHDKVGSAGTEAFGLAALAPIPLEGQSAEHGCFAGACGGTTDGAGSLRRVPEIGEHMHATLFDGGRLRVLVLVDHVLVGGLVHELLHFRFDPGGAERGEILLGVSVEDKLIVNGFVDGVGVPRAVGEDVGLCVGVVDFGLDVI